MQKVCMLLTTLICAARCDQGLSAELDSPALLEGECREDGSGQSCGQEALRDGDAFLQTQVHAQKMSGKASFLSQDEEQELGDGVEVESRRSESSVAHQDDVVDSDKTGGAEFGAGDRSPQARRTTNDCSAYTDANEIHACREECPKFESVGVNLSSCIMCGRRCKEQTSSVFVECHIDCLTEIPGFDKTKLGKLVAIEGEILDEAPPMILVEDDRTDDGEEDLRRAGWWWYFQDDRRRRRSRRRASVATCGGTGGGASCVFPFTFQDRTYHACTNVGHTEAWCATSYYPGSTVANDWGNCKRCCAPDDINRRRTSMAGISGLGCQYGFVYDWCSLDVYGSPGLGGAGGEMQKTCESTCAAEVGCWAPADHTPSGIDEANNHFNPYNYHR